jgi:hypothetical protein
MTLTGMPVRLNQTVSIGVDVAFADPPTGELVMNGVYLIDPPAELVLDDAVASTGRSVSHTCVGSDDQFPPPKCETAPLEGWSISDEAIAHGGFQIVLGLSISEEGVFGYPGVVLSYRNSSGDEFADVLLQGGQLCTPAHDDQIGCPRSGEIRTSQRVIARDIENGTLVLPEAST